MASFPLGAGITHPTSHAQSNSGTNLPITCAARCRNRLSVDPIQAGKIAIFGRDTRAFTDLPDRHRLLLPTGPRMGRRRGSGAGRRPIPRNAGPSKAGYQLVRILRFRNIIPPLGRGPTSAHTDQTYDPNKTVDTDNPRDCA